MQGDVLGIYESDGDQVAAYEYDAWGNRTIYSVSQVNGENIFTEVTYSQAIALNPVLNNSIGYRGYYYDTDMELYYLGSRYYDPVVGRFINADAESLITSNPLGITDKNLFSYCDNNPVIRKDSEGESWIVTSAVIGAVVSGVSTGISSYLSDGKVDWGGVAISAVCGAASGALSIAFPGIWMQAGISAAMGAVESILDEWRMKGFENINYLNVLLDASLSGGLSIVGNKISDFACTDIDGAIEELTKMKKATKIKATARKRKGHSYSGLMKEAQKYLKEAKSLEDIKIAVGIYVDSVMNFATTGLGLGNYDFSEIVWG